MKNMKPTKKQLEALRLMANPGWQMKFVEGFDLSCFIQETRTAKTVQVHLNTLFALRERKWIKSSDRKYPFTYYEITADGYEVIKNNVAVPAP